MKNTNSRYHFGNTPCSGLILTSDELDAGWLAVSYFVICIFISVYSRLKCGLNTQNERTKNKNKNPNEKERTSDGFARTFNKLLQFNRSGGFRFYLNDSVFHFHLIFIVHTHTASREISATITEACSRAHMRTTSFAYPPVLK